MPDWNELRKDFPALQRFRYFLAASGGPMPRPVYEKTIRYYREVMEMGDLNWEKNLQRREDARVLLARLIGAHPQDVEFISSTAMGMNLIADLLKDQGQVLATSLEFPDTTLPWVHRRRDAIRWVEPDSTGAVPAARYRERMTQRSSIIAVSHVQFSNGFRQDLEELGRLKQNHHFVVNATQSLGVFQINVQEMKIDALCANSYKWLMAGYGCGVLYVAPSLYSGRSNLGAGWFATKNREVFPNDRIEFADDASRFNWGSPSFPTIFALGASADYLLQIGMDQIENRVLSLAGSLVNRLDRKGFRILSPLKPEKYRSSSVLIQLDEPESVVEALRAQDILCTPKPEGIRVALHFFNSEEDIEILVKKLEEFCRSRRGYR